VPVEGLSAGVCSNSHPWNPFCPNEDLLTRVMKVVAVVIAAVVVYGIHHIWGSDSRDDDPPPSPTISQKPSTSTPQQSPQSKARPFANTQQIPLEDQVLKIPDIVKVSLDVLQKRAMPKEKGGETIRGFIKAEQNLLQVIQSNWNAEKESKMTRAQIVEHLQAIVKAARSRSNQEKAVHYDFITRTSDPDKGTSEMPRFIVQILKKRPTDTDIFRPEKASPDVGATNEEILIQNTAVPGKYIRWTPLRERFILQFGFYSLGMEIENVVEVLCGRVRS